jgi:hypothetical protein
MSYGQSDRRNPLDEITQHFAGYFGGVTHPKIPTDAQMKGLMQRFGERVDCLSAALEESTKRYRALLAEVDAIREQRDHWQRMAERLWTEQTRAGRGRVA